VSAKRSSAAATAVAQQPREPHRAGLGEAFRGKCETRLLSKPYRKTELAAILRAALDA
jgi:hypothetical protein